MNIEKEKQFNFPLLVQLSLFINSNMRKKVLFKLFIKLSTQKRGGKSSVNKLEVFENKNDKRQTLLIFKLSTKWVSCFLKNKLTIKNENETDFFKTLNLIFFSF